MKIKLILSVFVFLSSTLVHAYEEGTYKCKNSTGLPENILKIQAVSFGDSGPSLPLVEYTRYYRVNPGDANSEVKSSKLKGLAAVSEVDDSSMLILAAMRFDFVKNKLSGCEKQ